VGATADRQALDQQVVARAPRQASSPQVGRFAGPENVLALQRAIGNRAVARLAKADRQALHRACCGSCAAGHSCEDELLELDDHHHIGQPRAAVARQANRVQLQRYSHTDCSEDDLKSHIWPGDYVARQMVKKAVKALEADPIDPQVRAIFAQFFQTSTPKVAKILHVLDQLSVEFNDNDYKYECEDSCDDKCWAYTYSGAWGALTSANIHLCMNLIRGKDTACTAATIVHEMTHRYADTSDHEYCNECNSRTCSAALSEEKALDNADSYFGLVLKIWPLSL
jgi:Lysine-specific metallo-endopeptidase